MSDLLWIVIIPWTDRGGIRTFHHGVSTILPLFFADKIGHLHANLDSVLVGQNLSIHKIPSCLVLRDSCQMVQPEDIERVLGKVKPKSCVLNPYSSWLTKTFKVGCYCGLHP